MSNETPTQLTVKEAIEQGYTRYTDEDCEHHLDLSDVSNQPDFDEFEWFLVDKEPTILSVSAEETHEDLAENFATNRELNDDNDDFGDYIREAVNWQEVADKINAVLEKHPVYYRTHIKLVP